MRPSFGYLIRTNLRAFGPRQSTATDQPHAFPIQLYFDEDEEGDDDDDGEDDDDVDDN